jgi:hypothetical protein
LKILSALNKQLPKSIEDEFLNQTKKSGKLLSAISPDASRQGASIIEELSKLNPGPWRPQSMKHGPAWDAADVRVRKVIEETIKSINEYTKFDGFIRDMSLVYLVSQFESYLQRVLVISYEEHPQIIDLDKSLSLGQLMTCHDIGAAKNMIFEKEAADVLQKDIKEVAKYFRRKWNIRISEKPRWEAFVERFYKRNCIIHNNGRPDDNYRRKTGTTTTQPLFVNQEYLTDSVLLFSHMARFVKVSFSKSH